MCHTSSEITGFLTIECRVYGRVFHTWLCRTIYEAWNARSIFYWNESRTRIGDTLYFYFYRSEMAKRKGQIAAVLLRFSAVIYLRSFYTKAKPKFGNYWKFLEVLSTEERCFDITPHLIKIKTNWTHVSNETPRFTLVGRNFFPFTVIVLWKMDNEKNDC